MATLYTHQSKNIARTWLLVGVFLVLVLGIGYFLANYYQNPGILTLALIFSIVMNLTSFWYSDKITLSVSGAKPADENQFRELHRVVENLSIAAGLPKPRVYVINDPAPNAFATGRNKNHAAVAVTTGLLERLDRTELEGVLAHELAHVGNKDILLQSVVVVLVGFISLAADFFLRSMWFGGGRRDENNRGGGILAIIGIIFIILSPIIAQLIQLAISRKREYLADATGALITRYPEGLASALQKISSYSAPMQKAHNATAHLFIANPFGGQALQGLHRLFMTHPPVEKRIAALRDMAL